MDRLKVGIINPGLMGISIAATMQNSGHEVCWASQGRSPQSIERAKEHKLTDLGSIKKLCESCRALVSVVPPHAAEAVADEILAQGFKGLYIDANAVSPQKSLVMAGKMAQAGISFVDGGIIGLPAWRPHSTTLYLSGKDAETAAGLFSAGPLDAVVIGSDPCKASALKMCYASVSKGTTALLCSALAAAKKQGVLEELISHWKEDGQGLDNQAVNRARKVTAKAWRFVGEMHEISDTFSNAGLPGGFHASAAKVFERLAHLKESEEMPEIEEVLAAVLQEDT